MTEKIIQLAKANGADLVGFAPATRCEFRYTRINRRKERYDVAAAVYKAVDDTISTLSKLPRYIPFLEACHIADLVDTYTADNTAAKGVAVTVNGYKISAEVNLSAESGNQLILKEDGVYVPAMEWNTLA